MPKRRQVNERVLMLAGDVAVQGAVIVCTDHGQHCCNELTTGGGHNALVVQQLDNDIFSDPYLHWRLWQCAPASVMVDDMLHRS